MKTLKNIEDAILRVRIWEIDRKARERKPTVFRISNTTRPRVAAIEKIVK